MRTWRIIFVLAAALAWLTPAWAAEQRVCAQLSGRAPVVGATVAVTRADGAVLELTTGDDGCVTLPGLDAGSYALRIAGPGVRPLTTTLVLDGQDQTLSFKLRMDASDTEVIIIQGTQTESGVTRRELDPRTIQMLPGTQGDALKALQNFPGLARPPAIAGALLVRGSSPEDTAVFVDGQEIPQLYHFGGLTSVVATEALAAIDFLPGGFGVRYGGATGGVVDVRTRDGKRDALHGSADADLYDAAVVADAPVGTDAKHGTLFVAARRSYVDAILNAAIPADALVFTVAPRYYDYQLRYTGPVSVKGDEWSVLAYGADDALTFVIDEPPDPGGQFRGAFYFHTLFHRVQGDWSRYLNNGWLLHVQPGGGFARVVIDAGGAFGLDVKQYDITTRAEASGRLGRSVQLLTGVELEILPVDVGLKIAGETDAEPPLSLSVVDTLGSASAYVQAQIKPSRSTLVVPGVRFDGYFPQSKTNLDPRLSFQWDAGGTWSAKAYAGVYHKPPEPQEWNGELGNPDLKPSVAYQTGLGAAYRFGPAMRADVEVFHKWLDDLVVSVPVDPTNPQIEGGYSNEGIGRVYGAEVLLRRELTDNLYGWIAYTLSKSERASPYTPGGWYDFDFDQTHILTVLAGYRLPKNWEIGARFRYATGNPDTPVVGSLYDADLDAYLPVFGDPNSARIPAFHQLDIRIDKRWDFQTWQLGAYLDVQNAYNRANPEGVTYDFNYENQTTITGIPIFPSIGLRGEF